MAGCFRFFNAVVGKDNRDEQYQPVGPPTCPYGEDKKGNPRSLLLFDGNCLLCHGAVQFVLKWDIEDRFCFMPLQSSQGEQIQKSLGMSPSLNSVVLVDPSAGNASQPDAHMHSGAAVRVLWRLAQPLPIFGALGFLVPYPIRDLVYKIVAESRYTVFGKTDQCMMPNPRILTGEPSKDSGKKKSKMSRIDSKATAA